MFLVRWIKRLIILIIILVVAIPTIGFIALKSLDLNDFKPQIVSLVKEQTGRDLAINGGISAIFAIKPSVKVEQITLSNATWAKTKHIVDIADAKIVLDLMPLINGNLVIDNLSLNDAKINLQKTKKGTANWEFSKPKKAADKNKSVTENDEKLDIKIPTITPVINVVNITNLKLNYNDMKSGKNINLVVPKLTFNGSDKPTAKATLKSGDITADLSLSASSIESLIAGTANINLNVKGKAGENIKINGKLTDFAAKQQLSLSLNAKGNSIKSFASLIGKTPADIPAYDVKAHISGTPKKLSIKNLNAVIDNINISGELEVNLAKSKPYISGSLNIPSYTTQAAVALNDNQFADIIHDIAIISSANAEDTSKSTKVIADVAIPSVDLSAVNADIVLTVGKITAGKNVLSDVKAVTSLKNSVLKLRPLSFNMFGAGFTNNITLSFSGGSAKINLNTTTSNLTLEKLVKGLTGKNDATGGAMTNVISVSGSGNSLHKVIASLSGNATTFMKPATYKKPSKVVKAADFLELLQGKQHGDKIKIACYASKFNIAGGVMKPVYLVADASGAEIEGNGSINLSSEKLALTLYPRSKTIGLADLVVPLKVGGTFANPSFYPDPKGAIKSAGKIALALTGAGGIAAIAGSHLVDKLGITGTDNPCFSAKKPEVTEPTEEPADAINNESLKESPKEKVKEDDIKVKAKELEKSIRDIRDGKKLDLDNVKDNMKDLKGDLKNLKNLF